MSDIEKLLKQQSSTGEEFINVSRRALEKIFWQYKGLLKNMERNKAFWEATNTNLQIAYQKLDEQEKKISQLYKKNREEMTLAASIQKNMFPRKIPRVKGYSISAVCEMAEKSGGDLYDIIPVNRDKYLLIIGDVSGKGLPASLYMSSCINIIRALAEKTDFDKKFQLTIMIKTVNKLLKHIMGNNNFVTIFLGLLNTKTNHITYLSSGHMPCLLQDPYKKVLKRLNTRGIACGIFEPEIFDVRINEAETVVERGNYFILYTDGITEAKNEDEEEYGDRFFSGLHSLDGRESPGRVIKKILKGVKDFSRNTPQYDDLTLLCFRRDI